MNYKNIKNEEWSNILCGLRKTLNLSQTQLSAQFRICRQTIGRIEKKQRIPNEDSKNKILAFILKNNLAIEQIKCSGKDVLIDAQRREKSLPLKLIANEKLAELIGIILGDGEIKKDGSIRISFDPKKDHNFLYRKIFPLITENLGTRISYESEKRICFWNMPFVKYLQETCKLNPGSKFENHWVIPPWCFEKEEFISAVIRGLFDTDGYFGYNNKSLELMLGRFSTRSAELVQSIENAFIKLCLYPSVQQSKDGRYKIRLNSKESILLFFGRVGTSNLRHIVRFLLWRIDKYEAKIEIEGLPKLISLLEQKIRIDTKDLSLPFYWRLNQIVPLLPYLEEDLTYLQGKKCRNAYKWDALIKNLPVNPVRELGVPSRTFRRWRQGVRIPEAEMIPQILKIAQEKGLKLEEYKITDGKNNC